jgi:hypothetical protein
MASAAKEEVDDASEFSRPSSSSSSIGSSIRSGGDRGGVGLGPDEVDEDSAWEAEAEHPVSAQCNSVHQWHLPFFLNSASRLYR